ncbi:hypothetical protein A8M32_21730 [Sinorhizobium alkalisoli]|uniref:Uncharacterized protein n=1 Tax=Sinorhizobium alkalisoli TaxID=1752398 RepID=A0A1E3V6C5_9HYPH|nr:hypothetical protein A8M32_21730 [Sinorhizobium alkalisoli]
MAEMGVTIGAADFRSHHEMRAVDMFGDRIFVDRREIARPAAPGIELRVGPEEGPAATDAPVPCCLLLRNGSVKG